MSEIKAGDLVMVVRQPHCAGRALGKIYIVQDIAPRWDACHECGYTTEPDTKSAQIGSKGYWAPLSWLIRIDPPAEPASTETKEELTA